MQLIQTKPQCYNLNGPDTLRFTIKSKDTNQTITQIHEIIELISL